MYVENNIEAQEMVRNLIRYIGDDPDRAGMEETPARGVNSWGELFGGYCRSGSDVLKWFEDDTSEMVIVRDIEFFSTCEHHMLPFFGTADVGYIPNGAVVGLSKIARLVDVYARRFQIQERLAREIAEALAVEDGRATAPLGVAVQIRASHLCMQARGVRQLSAKMETNFLTGVFLLEDSARAEFLRK